MSPSLIKLSHPTQPRVAIIEDDESIHKLIKFSLDSAIEDNVTFSFKNSQQAIHELWESIGVTPPLIDILFIDIFLEDDTSGIDVLEYCQFVPQDIPIVLMSSNFTKHQLRKISKLHTAPILLRKPFHSKDIIQLTKWIFQLKSRRF